MPPTPNTRANGKAAVWNRRSLSPTTSTSDSSRPHSGSRRANSVAAASAGSSQASIVGCHADQQQIGWPSARIEAIYQTAGLVDVVQSVGAPQQRRRATLDYPHGKRIGQPLAHRHAGDPRVARQLGLEIGQRQPHQMPAA